MGPVPQECEFVYNELKKQKFPSVPIQSRVISETLRARIVAYIEEHHSNKPKKAKK